MIPHVIFLFSFWSFYLSWRIGTEKLSVDSFLFCRHFLGHVRNEPIAEAARWIIHDRGPASSVDGSQGNVGNTIYIHIYSKCVNADLAYTISGFQSAWHLN